MYGAIKATHSDLLNAGELAKRFVSNNQPEISKILIDAQRGRDDLIRRSTREEHEQWFEGVFIGFHHRGEQETYIFSSSLQVSMIES